MKRMLVCIMIRIWQDYFGFELMTSDPVIYYIMSHLASNAWTCKFGPTLPDLEDGLSFCFLARSDGSRTFHSNVSTWFKLALKSLQDVTQENTHFLHMSSFKQAICRTLFIPMKFSLTTWQKPSNCGQQSPLATPSISDQPTTTHW
jgi:hypothetical protein